MLKRKRTSKEKRRKMSYGGEGSEPRESRELTEPGEPDRAQPQGPGGFNRFDLTTDLTTRDGDLRGRGPNPTACRGTKRMPVRLDAKPLLNGSKFASEPVRRYAE